MLRSIAHNTLGGPIKRARYPLLVCRFKTSRTIHSSDPVHTLDAEGARAHPPPTLKPNSQKPVPLQLLPRPLGVQNPPRWMPLTREEKNEELFDEAKVSERRTVL